MPMSSKKWLHYMPMSSKKWLHGGLELCLCQARMVTWRSSYAHVKQEIVTWRSRTMPMSSKKVVT